MLTPSTASQPCRPLHTDAATQRLVAPVAGECGPTDPSKIKDITEGDSMIVDFTYSVKWKEITIPFEKAHGEVLALLLPAAAPGGARHGHMIVT